MSALFAKTGDSGHEVIDQRKKLKKQKIYASIYYWICQSDLTSFDGLGLHNSDSDA